MLADKENTIGSMLLAMRATAMRVFALAASVKLFWFTSLTELQCVSTY
jgi:hypothetical protein